MFAKKAFFILMISCFSSNILGMLITCAKSEYVNNFKSAQKFLEKHNTGKAKQFTASFNENSLDSVAGNFYSMHKFGKRKALSALNDKQLLLCAMGVCFSKDVNNHIMGFVFNGHIQRAEKYGELSFHEMSQMNIDIPKYMKLYPINIGDLSCSEEHYFNLTESQMVALHQACTNSKALSDDRKPIVVSPDNRELIASALHVIKNVEEDKIAQRRFDDQEQLTKGIITSSFSKSCPCVTPFDYFTRLQLCSGSEAQELGKEIVKEGKWHDFLMYAKKHKSELQKNFTFNAVVAASPSLKERLFALLASYQWNSFSVAPGAQYKWGRHTTGLVAYGTSIMCGLCGLHMLGFNISLKKAMRFFVTDKLCVSMQAFLCFFAAGEAFFADLCYKNSKLNQFIDVNDFMKKECSAS